LTKKEIERGIKRSVGGKNGKWKTITRDESVKSA
jgi:hypothetical protein